MIPSRTGVDRRSFLSAAAAAGSWAVTESFGAFARRVAAAESLTIGQRVPRLLTTLDEVTGLPLLRLPEGFRYRSFGWTGDPLAGGGKTPGGHDGMAVISESDGVLTLCRNHELNHIGAAFGETSLQYDPGATGGCTNLTFDTRTGQWGHAWVSIAGTANNCAGGPTPWGTWLTCEESVVQNGDKTKDGMQTYRLSREHGYIFEVPATKALQPQPLKDMGRFVHEAIAVDPGTGLVYETEDRKTAGFYRFVPKQRGHLLAGGELQMLAVKGHPDLSGPFAVGQPLDTVWVTIDDPSVAHSSAGADGLGVFSQGKAQGGTTFAKLEGCWWGNDAVYFIASNGGAKKVGQLWKYEPAQERLSLVYESPGPQVMDSPDNITVSPRGGIVLCEDPDRVPAKLHGLTRDGLLFDLAHNEIRLRGEKNNFKGDFRAEEWTGATFSPDGRWLFANLQGPGITFAITGPWSELGL